MEVRVDEHADFGKVQDSLEDVEVDVSWVRQRVDVHDQNVRLVLLVESVQYCRQFFFRENDLQRLVFDVLFKLETVS